MIFQLVYESTATEPFYSAELRALLTKSRTNNARDDITGMLLYHEGRFLQLLEGRQESVLACFEVIAADPRHKWVSLVMSGPNAGRDFPDWTMGFRDLDRARPPKTGWTDYLEIDQDEKPFPAASSAIRNIFLEFKTRDEAGSALFQA